MTKQLWAFVAIAAFFSVAKTYNDHAFVVWGQQGVELQRSQLAAEARIADALERAYPPRSVGSVVQLPQREKRRRLPPLRAPVVRVRDMEGELFLGEKLR